MPFQEMNLDEFERLLRHLGFIQSTNKRDRGQRGLARLLECSNDRIGRIFNGSQPVPKELALLLRLMAETKCGPDNVEAIAPFTGQSAPK